MIALAHGRFLVRILGPVTCSCSYFNCWLMIMKSYEKR